MKIVTAVSLIGLLTTPAVAQPAPPTDEGITLQQQLEQREKLEQQRRDRAAETEKAYQRLQKSSTPATTTKVDPWGNVRNADPKQANQGSQSKSAK
jgi:hypothetical protein